MTLSECESQNSHNQDSEDEEEAPADFSLATAIRRLTLVCPEAVTSAQTSTANLSAPLILEAPGGA